MTAAAKATQGKDGGVSSEAVRVLKAGWAVPRPNVVILALAAGGSDIGGGMDGSKSGDGAGGNDGGGAGGG
jgi:hypothetical protein